MHLEQESLPDTAFEAAIQKNGSATHEPVASAKKPSASKSMFRPVSYVAAEAAKKGNTSNSRTGKAKQVSYEFSKPPKGIYVKVHPAPDYHVHNLPVFEDENEKKFYYIDPALYESGGLPQRFQAACKIMDVHTAGLADGTFILWFVFVSSSKWRKGAVKAVEAAKREYVIVRCIMARQSYSIEPADQAIPEPQWATLPPFDQMLMDAFDSTISVADDKIVTDYMSGGVASRHDGDEDGY
jgi:hypothetical protein